MNRTRISFFCLLFATITIAHPSAAAQAPPVVGTVWMTSSITPNGDGNATAQCTTTAKNPESPLNVTATSGDYADCNGAGSYATAQTVAIAVASG